ncbi:DUF6443 domain-containing protein [Chryseobacterium sp. SIMBA_029]|uniref:DUF6443 domain-containing protein n=2 Tax=Bacteria TaxID=2 RepID=UPI003978856B
MKTYIINILCLFIAVATQAQTGLSGTENYMYTKNCLDSTCTKKSEAVKYFDGLGRLRQVIDVKGSPLGNDLVQPVLYDAFGKKTRNYYPIPQSGSSNGALYGQTSGMTAYPVTDATNFYIGEKIFTEKTIESSPLNRVQQQVQVGNDWNNKPVLLGYYANSASDQVRYFKTTSAWIDGSSKATLTDAGFYGASQLFKNSIKDEDGNEKLVFKNTKGQTLLERRGNSGNFADTYFIYDKYDHLVFILPPLAAKETDIATNETKRSALCYENRYDGRNRVVERKFPGKGWEYMVYDKQDRPIATRDAILKTKGQWLFTKYDSYGRVAFTGIASGGERSMEQTNASAFGINNVKRTQNISFNREGMDVYYDQNNTYPSAGLLKILSVNYYDSYPAYSFNPPFPSSILGQPVLTNTQTVNTQGSPTISLVKNIENDDWTKNYMYYDTKNRVIGSYSINHLGGYTKNEMLLNFAGVAQKINTYHLRKAGEVAVTLSERFVYDSQNRLKRHYHTVDSRPEELLSENTYNELSQLVNKKVGYNLQSIDYNYNIRGWLTDINKDQMAIADMGGKLFSYKIKYNQKDGITNPDSGLFSGKDVVPRYNGNITEVDWRAIESIGDNPSLTPKRYGYAYDGMNRLTAGYYQNPQNPYSREHTESLGYDVNGNITDLYRTSVTENLATTATVIDKLNYIYTSGNQVSNIIDNTGNPSGYEGGGSEIKYDLNGNMTQMVDKNLSNIIYNYLDLPSKIEYQNLVLPATLSYLYNADGTKLQKSSPRLECNPFQCYMVTDISDYLDGFQYQIGGSGNGEVLPELRSVLEKTQYAYEQQAFSSTDLNEIQNPQLGTGLYNELKNPDLKFFPTAEGFYDYQNDQYIYQYKDHLGNARISFARNSKGALSIIDANDYYPFGMNHLNTGNAFVGQASFTNYKFLGKELQETGFYDLGARFYMPDIGRFNTHDPLSDSTLDPYGYAYNNPLFFTDVTGLRSDPINGGQEIGGPNGLNGPGEDPKPNELGGSANPYNIPEIVINAPIRAIASNPGSIMPSYCSVCYSGNGTSSGITLTPHQVQPLPLNWNCGHCNDKGGVIMMDSMIWDLIGIVAAENMDSESQTQAVAVGALAIILTRGKAAPKILQAEAGIAKAELAAEKGILNAEAKAISKEAVATNGTLNNGPYAGEGLLAKNGKSRNFTTEERTIINQQGYTLGCHTCGQVNPGTKSGNFILDHQPANALVPDGWPQTFYPHCKYCSASQGGIIGGMKRQGILPKFSK